MGTHLFVLREKQHWDINSGGMDFGRITCETSRITYRLCTSSIWNDSAGPWWAISSVRFISNSRQTRIALPILTKIYRTTHSIKYQSLAYHKNGCGASLGVQMKPRQLPRRSIYATILCTRNLRFQWPSELSAGNSLKRVGLN